MYFTNKLSKLSVAICLASSYAVADKHTLEHVEVIGKELNGQLGLDSENGASNRLGLSSMEVPASLQLISKELIALKDDYSAIDAVTRSTGFSSSASPGNGGTSMAVRGFNGHSAVVQTYNGNRMYVGAGTSTFPADSWVLDRVEILRDPGSVINGTGAIGATVNYVSKKPTFEAVQHEAQLVLGSNNLNRIAYGSGGKVNETTAYRFDAVRHQTDGFIDRAEEKRQVLAGALLFKPQDDLNVQLSIDYDNIEDAPYWGTPLINGKLDKSIRKENYNAEDGLVEYENFWPQLTVEWKINDRVTFHNNTYYLKANRHWRNIEKYEYNQAINGFDRSYYFEIKHDQKQIGNRSDFSFDTSVAGLDNRFNIGFEINKINFTHTNNFCCEGSSQVSLKNPNVGKWAETISNNETLKAYTTETEQYAIFLDDHLQISSQLSVVAGLRYDNIEIARNNLNKATGEIVSKRKNNFSNTSWRLGTVFQPNESTSLYAQYSSASTPPGSLLTLNKDNLTLETGKQVELGIKQKLFDDKVQYTVAIFDITKKDVISRDSAQATTQVGQQSSKGFEFEFNAAINEQFNINANLAVIDAQYDDFNRNGTIYNGNQPRNVPEKTANVWVNYQPTDDWLLGTGFRHVSKRYADYGNTAEMPAYTVFDANVKWQVASNLSVNAAVKNFTDEIDYVLTSNYGPQWVLGDGRSYELGVNYKF